MCPGFWVHIKGRDQLQSVEKPTSEELLEAVKAFLGDKKQETYEAAIRTLLQVLEDDKSVMVPIHKTSVGSKDAYNVPSTLSASNGKWYYIVYTSEREIPVGRADVMTYMPLRSMFRLVGSTADCGGICLEPWDRDGLFVPSEYIRSLLDELN